MGPPPGEAHTKADELQRWGHLLRAQWQAADGDGWDLREDSSGDLQPRRPGTWRGLQHKAPAPPHRPQDSSAIAQVPSPAVRVCSPSNRMSLVMLGQHPSQASTHCPIPVTILVLSEDIFVSYPPGWEAPTPGEAASGSGLVPTCVFQ